MKLPIYKRISREDLQEAPDWIGKMLYPINQVFETVYNTLNKNLTFADNFLSFQKSVQFTTKSTYTAGDWDVISVAIPQNFRNKVSGVIILKFSPTNTSLITNSDPFSLIWAENDRTVQLLWVAGLQNSTSYDISILVV